LTRFSSSGCKILWDKRTRIPKRDKVAIKEDLKTISNLIEEAMTYTKEKLLEENREIEVKFWLNTKTSESYHLAIHYDLGMEAWHFYLDSDSHESVGEVINEKWPCLQILLDKDVEEEPL